MLTHLMLAALVGGAAIEPSGADSNVVTITGAEFTYRAPDTLAAGVVTFRLVNQGRMFHQAQIVRLAKGRTFEDVRKYLKGPRGPLPPWMTEMGGPNAVTPAGPGNPSVTVALAPGNYAVLCFVDQPDGVLHATKGMAKALTVVAPRAGAPKAAAPKADITLTLSNYTFELSGRVTRGRHTFKVTTTTAQSHEVVLVKLDRGRSLADLIDWMSNPRGSGPPGAPVGGVAGLARGTTTYFTADFGPGDYGFICFRTDRKSGKPHFVHGMTKQFLVM